MIYLTIVVILSTILTLIVSFKQDSIENKLFDIELDLLISKVHHLKAEKESTKTTVQDAKVVCSGRGRKKGSKMSGWTKRKISKTHKERWADLTPEQKRVELDKRRRSRALNKTLARM